MSTTLESGAIVAGYRIERLLGRGGMAAVYLAEDVRLKRKVALKVLAPELGQDETFRRRFVGESERLASVDHPNIIPVYDAGEDGDVLFIAMRYVDSTDLKHLIAKEGGLPPARAVSLVGQVAAALDAAHERGLVHRDVKPANVLVASSRAGEHAYLSDFGLTKRTEETSGLTKTGHFMGTIDYVAPEQITGKGGVDARTDQYALACVLFEALTGHPPYRKDDDAAVLFSHLSEPAPKVLDERPELPPAIDVVIGRGMAKEKADRFRNCLDLANAAAAALGERAGDLTMPVVAPETELVAEVQPRRRGRWVALVGGIVAALAIVAGIVVLASGGGGGDQPVTVLSLDGSSGAPKTTLHDEAFTEHLWGILSVEDGYLWQATEDSLVRRDEQTGKIQGEIDLPPGYRALDGGFGYAWAATTGRSVGVTELHRIDPLSGATKTFEVEGGLADMRAGNGAIWVLAPDGTLSEVDPINGKVTNTFDTGTETPGAVVPMAGYVWICECEVGRVAQFDPRTDEIVRELELPEHGFVFGVDSSTEAGERVWLLDPDANTLTPIDPDTGEVGRPIGVGGAAITDAKVLQDTLWVSSQTEVTKIDLSTFDQDVFEIPEGISAGSVAPLADGSLVWVANCGCPIE